MYISLYVDVNTFIGGHQPQNKLMRLRTFKKNPLGAHPLRSLVGARLSKKALKNLATLPPEEVPKKGDKKAMGAPN